MNTFQAAEIIGCTAAHVRLLCQTGKLKARKRPFTVTIHASTTSQHQRSGWDISLAEVQRYARKAKRKDGRGRPRTNDPRD